MILSKQFCVKRFKTGEMRVVTGVRIFTVNISTIDQNFDPQFWLYLVILISLKRKFLIWHLLGVPLYKDISPLYLSEAKLLKQIITSYFLEQHISVEDTVYLRYIKCFLLSVNFVLLLIRRILHIITLANFFYPY